LATKNQWKSRPGLGGLRRDAHRLDACASALRIHGQCTAGTQAEEARAGRGQLQVCRGIPGEVAEGLGRLCSGEVKAAVLKAEIAASLSDTKIY